ncbi:hypothetical protein Nepgr_023677 [Nepenthes gracilis]|uniref:Uncharacterized protein n=1 Tax=Nepenthes gracilis TaxID=150966 RepID=A0AAD3T383_NEPGR|nr:hypothetical protein Nepgr_023677 [Nepenthes gracilis]
MSSSVKNPATKMVGKSKLKRTQSSLVRSSPTSRSYFQGLSSIADVDLEAGTASIPVDDHREEPKKPAISRPISFRPVPALTAAALALFILFCYFRTCEISTFEKFLLALIFTAVSLLLTDKNKRFLPRLVSLLPKSVSLLKKFYNDGAKKLGFSKNPPRERLKVYIGDAPGTESEELLKMTRKEGAEYYYDGDSYEGGYHKGKYSGSGVYSFNKNGRYEGDWVDGKFDGYGIDFYRGGSEYRGEFRKGLRHGFGVFRSHLGYSYSGEWSHGRCHGVGIQGYRDGTFFVGQFKDGVRHGLGCQTFRNGDRFAGEYFLGVLHGYGFYYYVNGHYYEGSMYEGFRYGYGSYNVGNGETLNGYWNYGMLQTMLTLSTDSVVQAVEKGRKTAEDAMQQRSVDEQVNDAVAAANRAAAAARAAAVKASRKSSGGKV